MTTARPRLLLVSPRRPRRDGQGDQRRAQEILDALAEEWEVDVVSWLPDAGELHRPYRDLGGLARAAALAFVRPLQVAYVQGMAPSSVRRRLGGEGYDRVVYVTNRAVPLRFADDAVVDFIDDLGGSALKRARTCSGPAGLLWRWEGWRTRRFDRRIAGSGVACVAHGTGDAARIGAGVRAIPLAACTKPAPERGDRIAFVGNLFYAPNHEAAMWICTELAPQLASLGVDPARILLAGRRPLPALAAAAGAAGVELRPDVDDLSAALYESAIVLAPMRLGSGAQYKVIDATAAGRVCVLSPTANDGLGLVDGVSGLVRDREREPFADAIVALLDDPALRARLAAAARTALAAFLPEAVAASWRAAVAPKPAPVSL